MSLPALRSSSARFGQIEQELQIQLNCPSVLITDCFDLSNPESDSNFAVFAESVLPQNFVSVFVARSDLSQSPEAIRANGFRFNPRAGFRFRPGVPVIDRSQPVIEAVCFTVALGRCLNFQPSALEGDNCEFLPEAPTPDALRSDYRSLCISSSHDCVVFNPA
jgi:hypothetical protein